MATAPGNSRISVVIPAYNAGETIGACLASVFSQTRMPLEIILVDDGSTDNTLAAVPSSDMIRILRGSHHGAPAARNLGAAAARGEMVLFCDADVVLRPNALERFADALERHPGASFAYCSFTHGHLTFHAPPFNATRLRKRNYLNTTSLIRRVDLIRFDESLSRFQDWDFFLTLAAQGKWGAAIPDILFVSSRDPKRGISRPGFRRWLRAYRDIRRKHRLPLDTWAIIRQLLFHLGR